MKKIRFNLFFVLASILLLQNFALANGNAAPFDRNFFYTLFEKSIKRTRRIKDLIKAFLIPKIDEKL